MSKKKRVTKQQSVQTEIIDVELKQSTLSLVTDVIGKTVADATKLAEAVGKTVRITRTDNSYHIGSPEYSPKRLNLEVEKGLVVRSAIG